MKTLTRRGMLLAAAVLLAVWGAFAQQAPETAAGKQFAAWLQTFNSGDRATLLQYFEKNYPQRANDIDGALQFRAMTGGFDLKKVEAIEATKLTALVKEKDSDQFVRLSLEVEEAEPHKVMGVVELRACPTPAEFKPARMSENEVVLGVKKLGETRAAEDKFSGAVAISKNGKTIFAQAYGLADREKKTPNTLATQFRIGSMNKMFTATAILQLAQAGKLKLTDSLGKYLTDYPNQDVATKVTIHQLLTHTGGTGDFFGPEFDKHRLELKTLQDYVKLYGTRGPAPGMNGDLRIFPESGYVIAVLSNLDPPAAERISSYASNRLPVK